MKHVHHLNAPHPMRIETVLRIINMARPQSGVKCKKTDFNRAVKKTIPGRKKYEIDFFYSCMLPYITGEKTRSELRNEHWVSYNGITPEDRQNIRKIEEERILTCHADDPQLYEATTGLPWVS